MRGSYLQCHLGSPEAAGGSLHGCAWGRVHRIAVVDLGVSEDWTARTLVGVGAGWVGEAWRRLSNAVGHWRGGHGQGRADLLKIDCSSPFVFFWMRYFLGALVVVEEGMVHAQ